MARVVLTKSLIMILAVLTPFTQATRAGNWRVAQSK